MKKKKKKKRKAINKKRRNNTAEYKKNAYVIVSHFNRMMAKPIKQGSVIYLWMVGIFL